jgi:hypothetical protein
MNFERPTPNFQRRRQENYWALENRVANIHPATWTFDVGRWMFDVRKMVGLV